MHRKLNITCSSNLLFNTSYWDSLKIDYKLNFSDYGDFKNSLLKSDGDEAVCFFLFLEDILKGCNNNSQKKKSFKSNF